LSAGIFAGCAGGNTPAGSTSAASEAKTGLGIKHARLFNIDYLDNGVKLMTDPEGKKLLLVPIGTNAPPGYDDAAVIETPITRAMSNSITNNSYLDALEDDSLRDSITVVNRSTVEEIVKANPDIVFLGNGMGDVDIRLGSLLDEVNIKHAAVTEWEEVGNAAELEWIKFFAAFFNLDEKADRIYEAKIACLNELYEKAASASYRPTVAYGLISRGVVYTQSGSSILAGQIEKAGGIYVFKELEGFTSSVRISMEELLDKGRNADIFIYGSLPEYCPDKAFLLETEPLMAEFKAFKSDRIFAFDRDYYINRAKVVERFEDMVYMFHPDMFSGHEFSMYRKLD